MARRSSVMWLVVAVVLLLAGAGADAHDGHSLPDPTSDAATLPDPEGIRDPGCMPYERWSICWHEDLPPPGPPRKTRSLREMRREAGGRLGLRPFRSTGLGAVIDVDQTGLGGIAGPADLEVDGDGRVTQTEPDTAPAPGISPEAGVAPEGGSSPATSRTGGGRERPSPAAGTPGILCLGNGTSGNRVQAVYAYSGTNHADQVVPLIRRWAADVEATVRLSAKEAGGRRHVRWVHTPGCVLSVMIVKVSGKAAGNESRFFSELAKKGLKRPDRRYLAWMDGNLLCGVGTLVPDDRGGKTNPNNGFPYGPAAWTRVDRGCWGLRAAGGHSVESHELFHNLGAVQDSAPNSTRAGHCYDEWDVMCYADGGPRSSMRIRCTDRGHEALLDCGHNDYFDPTPKRGSYLSKRWNTARSSFLDGGTGAPPLIVSIGATPPDTGLGDETAQVPLTIEVVTDAPIAAVELGAAKDGGAAFAPITATGGSRLAPIVTLERGHDWALSAVAVDKKGRRSAPEIAEFSLPRDLKPVVGAVTLSLDSYDGPDAWVQAEWDEDDDGSIEDRQVQVSADRGGTWTAVTEDIGWGWWQGKLPRGGTYRVRVRIQDDVGQWSPWVASRDLRILPDRPPTVTKPVATLQSVDAGLGWVIVDWTADDDEWIQAQELLMRVDGAAPTVLEADAYPGSWYSVDAGHTYRFLVRVTDSAGQATTSTASDPLVVP